MRGDYRLPANIPANPIDAMIGNLFEESKQAVFDLEQEKGLLQKTTKDLESELQTHLQEKTQMKETHFLEVAVLQKQMQDADSAAKKKHAELDATCKKQMSKMQEMHQKQVAALQEQMQDALMAMKIYLPITH